MVRRVYEPGCQFDNLIILEGAQGIFKTTMLRILGGEWYAPFSIKADSKDAVDVMRGKWLLEMEELAQMRSTDIEHVKAFLSRKVDRVRLSYRMNAQDFPRQSVLIGTMNPVGDNTYFKDSTGNRRFWPIACNSYIDVEWIKENRDQIFAEAMRGWRTEPLFLDKKESLDVSIAEQEERQAKDPWLYMIEDYLIGKNSVTPIELLTKACHCSRDKITVREMTKIGICMKALGWERRQTGIHKKKFYLRPGLSGDEIIKGCQLEQEWEDS